MSPTQTAAETAVVPKHGPVAVVQAEPE
jgi:hypothetical protein